LTSAQSLADNLETLHSQAKEGENQLRQWQQRAVSIDDLHQVRADLVGWAREAGCQVRQIQIDQGKAKPWHENENPLSRVKNLGKKTPYDFSIHHVAVSVTGTAARIRTFLSKVSSNERLIHTQKCVLRPVRKGEKDVLLQMDLLLFDLEQRSKSA
jgi:Tfp pilus assembly protein PilO